MKCWLVAEKFVMVYQGTGLIFTLEKLPQMDVWLKRSSCRWHIFLVNSKRRSGGTKRHSMDGVKLLPLFYKDLYILASLLHILLFHLDKFCIGLDFFVILVYKALIFRSKDELCQIL